LIPITKPRKEHSKDVSKFRPISLLNVGGKILEKALINRINHHVFSQNFMNNYQYGVMPHRNIVDAAMEVKDFIRKGLTAGEVIVLVNLNVKDAFDAAWWPSILNGLRACDCPRNLYDLTNSYQAEQLAIIKGLETIESLAIP
jgi:hypothetical protein